MQGARMLFKRPCNCESEVLLLCMSYVQMALAVHSPSMSFDSLFASKFDHEKHFNVKTTHCKRFIPTVHCYITVNTNYHT